MGTHFQTAPLILVVLGAWGKIRLCFLIIKSEGINEEMQTRETNKGENIFS